MNSNDEIVDSLMKKSTEMEKQVTKFTENPTPDYTIAINTIITEVRDIKQNNNRNEELTLRRRGTETYSSMPLLSAYTARLTELELPVFSNKFFRWPSTVLMLM